MDLQNELKFAQKLNQIAGEINNEISPNKTTGHDRLRQIIGPLLVMNTFTAGSIGTLCERKLYADAIALTRTYVERSINILYIISNGKEAILEALKHAQQKEFRDVYKEVETSKGSIKIGLNFPLIFKYFPEKEALLPEDLRESLADYTTKKGKPITAWTPKTINERIKIIGAHMNPQAEDILKAAYYFNYGDISEIIHGTYYSYKVVYGGRYRTDRGKKTLQENFEHIIKSQEDTACLHLKVVTSVMCVLIIGVTSKFESPALKELRNKSRKIIDKHNLS